MHVDLFCANSALAYLKEVTPSLVSWRLETCSMSAFFLKSSSALVSNLERILGGCFSRISFTSARSRPAKAGAVLGLVVERVVGPVDLASICLATCSASAQSAKVLAVRSCICSMSWTIGCQGTHRAAALIKTPPAPQRTR